MNNKAHTRKHQKTGVQFSFVLLWFFFFKQKIVGFFLKHLSSSLYTNIYK